jgi:glutathione reductase (NADPH)
MMIIGTGSAASAAAYRCRAAGWQVAIVDSKPFGGTYTLRGCDPKNLLGHFCYSDPMKKWRGSRSSTGSIAQWPERLSYNVEIGKAPRTDGDQSPESPRDAYGPK